MLISARRVAPTGNAIGLDMTDEMLALARANAAEAGVDNVEFIKGYIEAIPLPDASVDVVISNCVINLAADKREVLAEAARVLRPGGRFAVSDVIADPDMDEATRADMAAYTGCIAGALTEEEFRAGLSRRRPRRRRDSTNPSRPCACQLGDHPSAQAGLGLTRRVLTAFAASNTWTCRAMPSSAGPRLDQVASDAGFVAWMLPETSQLAASVLKTVPCLTMLRCSRSTRSGGSSVTRASS